MNTSLIDTMMWKKLFMMYFKTDISEIFLSTANEQLSQQFMRKFNLKELGRSFICWQSENDLKYTQGLISKLDTQLFLMYGQFEPTIAWKSKSGRIYNLSDDDIDTNDIVFWFENLDEEKIQQRINPIWTLFFYHDMYQNDFKRFLNIKISEEFITCLDKQLTNLFELKTGIKINRHISVAISGIKPDYFNYKKGPISQYSHNFYFNHNWEKLTIKWKSRTSRIYEFHDTDIDCDDIEFWFDNLDVALVHKYLYPKVSLPFKLKDLTYELVVTRINMDCSIEMHLKEGIESEISIKQIDNFIADFNEKSEKKDRKDGVVHNWKREFVDDKIVYELDLGSTGAVFLKKLFLYFSKLNTFEKIEIC